jgi:ribosomal protein S7
MPPCACAAEAVASIVVSVAIEIRAMRQRRYALANVVANCISKFD